LSIFWALLFGIALSALVGLFYFFNPQRKLNAANQLLLRQAYGLLVAVTLLWRQSAFFGFAKVFIFGGNMVAVMA